MPAGLVTRPVSSVSVLRAQACTAVVVTFVAAVRRSTAVQRFARPRWHFDTIVDYTEYLTVGFFFAFIRGAADVIAFASETAGYSSPRLSFLSFDVLKQCCSARFVPSRYFSPRTHHGVENGPTNVLRGRPRFRLDQFGNGCVEVARAAWKPTQSKFGPH